MNRLVLLFSIIFLCFNAKTQDRIININHDTIHCKILSISKDRIMYEQKNNDEQIIGKFIQLSQVSEYLRSNQPEKKEEKTELNFTKLQDKPKSIFYFGLNAGSSIMPWYFDNFSSSYVIPDYFKKIKKGFQINANVYYLINSFFGAGVEYSFFKTSTSGSMPIESSSSLFLIGSEKYRFYFNYLGTSALFQQYIGPQQKIILKETISAGIMLIHLENQNTSPDISQTGYRDVSYNMLIAGETFSGKFGITAEYKLVDAFSVGLGADFFWSTLKKADIDIKGPYNYNYSKDNDKLKDPLKISRVGYSIVLHYYFNEPNN